MRHQWKISRGTLTLGSRTLIMGVLNVTPDSFSDGGLFISSEDAIRHADEMVRAGADIIDIGGESTRPGESAVVQSDEEMNRILPVIEGLSRRMTVPISVDTTKAAVAEAAINAGAAIINDISALRFDQNLADVAAQAGAGLILMHSRGYPGALHGLPAVADILTEVTESLRQSISLAENKGVRRESIVIDPGIGFGKTQEQNLELIANLDVLAKAFPNYPILVGTSRKSFIGRILNGAAANERLHGTMASVTTAVLRGAHIVRVHDVKAALETVKVVDAIKTQIHQSPV